jgi:major membrane immunogen (membrane-anchored lipoprotein)
MIKASVVPCMSVFCLVLIVGCGGKAKLEKDTARFKDYKYLEDSLTMVMSFPNKSFSALYDKFRQDYGWDGDISGLKDGVYDSYSTIDLRGYVHYARFTVAKGAFVSVYYDEFKPGDSSGKKYDTKYGQSVSRKNPDILTNAYASLETNLISSQNPVNIDSVSGATLASYRFQIAVLKAIYEATTKHTLNTVKYGEGPGLMSNAGKEAKHD